MTEGKIRFEGLVLALLGFAISRFVVAESLQTEAAVPFFVASLVPLVLGLALAVFGVVLAVGTFPPAYVRSVTLWAVGGAAAMTLVIALTGVAALLRGDPMHVTIGPGLFVANVLLGGAIGGAITGDRVAANRRNREEIERQADRATLINRILRHEVLNAATIVQGYAEMLTTRQNERAVDSIRDAATRIESTVEDVGTIADDSTANLRSIDLVEIVADETAAVGAETVDVDLPDEAIVRADDRIRIVVRELLKNALSHGAPADSDEDVTVRVGVRVDETTVRLRVFNSGPPISGRERKLLEAGTLPEYDDPTSGFGLQTVRLLVEYYDGSIGIESDGGTTVTVTLPRDSASGVSVSGLDIGRRDLLAISGAAVVAGVFMGVYLQYAAGLLPVIGALYAVPNQTVGWIVHLFHSVVFGLLFAAGTTRVPLREHDGVGALTLLGVGWGVFLWLFAAGIVMPVWLQLLGLEAILPNLTSSGFVGHALWGGIIGGLYAIATRD